MKSLRVLKLLCSASALIVLLLIILLCSCSNSRSRRIGQEDVYKHPLIKVKIIENGCITWVDLNKPQELTMHVNDTVWVDVVHHIVDDTCNTAMKGVLLRSW
jgi:hypothetical protein